MKESAFQKWCVDEAVAEGWVVKHVPTPMRPVGNNRFVPDARGAGVPDLLLIHEDPPRLIFAELKNETGKLSPEQSEVLRMLRQVSAATVDVDGHRTVGVYVWMPAVKDIIRTILRSRVMVSSSAC